MGRSGPDILSEMVQGRTKSTTQGGALRSPETSLPRARVPGSFLGHVQAARGFLICHLCVRFCSEPRRSSRKTQDQKWESRHPSRSLMSAAFRFFEQASAEMTRKRCRRVSSIPSKSRSRPMKGTQDGVQRRLAHVHAVRSNGPNASGAVSSRHEKSAALTLTISVEHRLRW